MALVTVDKLRVGDIVEYSVCTFPPGAKTQQWDTYTARVKVIEPAMWEGRPTGETRVEFFEGTPSMEWPLREFGEPFKVNRIGHRPLNKAEIEGLRQLQEWRDSHR